MSNRSSVTAGPIAIVLLQPDWEVDNWHSNFFQLIDAVATWRCEIWFICPLALQEAATALLEGLQFYLGYDSGYHAPLRLWAGELDCDFNGWPAARFWLTYLGVPPNAVLQHKLGIYCCTNLEELQVQLSCCLPRPTLLPRIHWQGHFFAKHSLAYVNRELCLALLASGRAELAIDSTGPLPEGSDITTAALVTRMIDVPPMDAQILVRHEWPPRFDPPNAGKYVHIQPWEFGALPCEWRARLMECADEIWCYTSYVRKLYLAAGFSPERVWTVPLGIDPVRFRPDAPPMALPTTKNFKLLYVGGTIMRKGIDLLLDAYLKAFSAADDVVLVIKDSRAGGCYTQSSFRILIDHLRRQPGTPEILYTDQEFGVGDLVGLYRACDCLVHPYRGEGFGLPVLEALACGLPVIVTDGGATDDFVDSQWGWRLNAERISLGSSIDGVALVDEGWWLQVDPRLLVEALRFAIQDQQHLQQMGAAASCAVRERWTWRRSAALAMARIAALTE